MKFLIPFNHRTDAYKIQQWLYENKIKHGPTNKITSGWVFEIFDNENFDSMIFKIMWGDIIKEYQK